jgi:hypothetical protein
MPDFEVFKDRGTRRQDQRPAVTLQTKGVMAMNPAAYEALGSPEAVELLYAQKAETIGIRAVDPSVAHAYRPRKQKGGHARSVAAQAFFSHYGIHVDATRRYPARMIGDVLAIDLSQPVDGQG